MVFSGAALSEKNEEKSVITNFGHVEDLLSLPVWPTVRKEGCLLELFQQLQQRNVTYTGEYGDDRGHTKNSTATFWVMLKTQVFIKRDSEIRHRGDWYDTLTQDMC